MTVADELVVTPALVRRVASVLGGADRAELVALADRLEAEGRVTVTRPAYTVTYVDPGRDRTPPAG